MLERRESQRLSCVECLRSIAFQEKRLVRKSSMWIEKEEYVRFVDDVAMKSAAVGQEVVNDEVESLVENEDDQGDSQQRPVLRFICRPLFRRMHRRGAVHKDREDLLHPSTAEM